LVAKKESKIMTRNYCQLKDLFNMRGIRGENISKSLIDTSFPYVTKEGKWVKKKGW